MVNILVVVEKNNWFDWHISATFEHMGHKVTTFYFGEYLCEFYGKKRHLERVEKNKLLYNKATELLHQNGLDLIFCYVQDDFMLPEYAQRIEKLEVPFVNYCVDMACQWYRLTKTAKYFSHILCGQPTNITSLEKYAKKVLYFPMATRKMDEKLLVDFNPHSPVTFLGTPTDYRVSILSSLCDASIPLSVYGKYWKNKDMSTPVINVEKSLHDIRYYSIPRLTGEGFLPLLDALRRRFNKYNKSEMRYIPETAIHDFLPSNAIACLFKNSKINIGFTKIIGDYRGIYQMRLRDFEVPLAGGFYLVEKAPGYEEFFIPGQEVITWTSFRELKDKVFYFLKNDKEREEIAKAGQMRAFKEHTWEHRFNYLFKELQIK